MHFQDYWGSSDMAASVDEDKVLELYDRDKLIIDNLPFYLRPSIGFDEKAQHIFFDKLGSRVIYQLGTQKSGLGQGRQFDVTHLTECASWPYPGIIEHDWMPTIPQSPRAFALLESTAQGRGNWWHQQIKKLQDHRLRRWHLVFIPWYAELKKYKATPPVDWNPSEEAMAHAQRVYETSNRAIASLADPCQTVERRWNRYAARAHHFPRNIQINGTKTIALK